MHHPHVASLCLHHCLLETRKKRLEQTEVNPRFCRASATLRVQIPGVLDWPLFQRRGLLPRPPDSPKLTSNSLEQPCYSALTMLFSIRRNTSMDMLHITGRSTLRSLNGVGCGVAKNSKKSKHPEGKQKTIRMLHFSKPCYFLGMLLSAVLVSIVVLLCLALLSVCLCVCVRVLWLWCWCLVFVHLPLFIIA